MEYNNELYHHGVKGMRWGVRRYQNSDGSLTNAGRRRYGDDGNSAHRSGSRSVSRSGSKAKNAVTKSPEEIARRKAIAKKVLIGTVLTGTVAAAAVMYAKNPAAVNAFMSRVGSTTVSSLKTAGRKAVDAGKRCVRQAPDLAKRAARHAYEGVREGAKEAIKEAPKKATKTVITGATMLAAKRLLDSAVGKPEAERVFKANDKKKIASFWKVIEEGRDDDDD